MTDTALIEAPAPTGLTMRACVLREPGRPPAVEIVSLEPPRAGEGLVKVAAAGVCHSDIHLADGQLGDAGEPVPAAISASPSLLSDWHRTQRRAT